VVQVGPGSKSGTAVTVILDVDGFLAARPDLPMKTLKEIIGAKKYHPS